MIGIGILTYNSPSDLRACITSIKNTTSTDDVEIMVFDNSDTTTEAERLITRRHRDVIYLHEQHKNIGCTRSRNIMYRTFKRRHPRSSWLIIMDNDVEVQPQWLPSMANVALRHPQAGIVAWPLANMRPFPVDMTNGCITAAASVCHLHRMSALAAVDRRWSGPWDERFFFYRFDSLMCDRMNMLGWRTHLIMDTYKHGVSWMKQPCRILHNHPHTGIKRNADYRRIRNESDTLYKRIMKTEGWQPYDPLRQSYNWRKYGELPHG